MIAGCQLCWLAFCYLISDSIMVSSDRNLAMAAKREALKAFGVRVRRARTKIGLTQEAVAELLGVSTQSVRNWEAGRTEPGAEVKSRLAALYQVSVDSLLSEDTPAEAEPQDGLDPEQAELQADWQLIENEASLALRQVARELSPEAIKAIADFVRFTHEREERERREG